MSNKYVKSLLLNFFFIFILFSCRKNKDDVLLDLKNIIKPKEIKKGESFGVINVNRLRFRSDNDIHARTLMYLDKGEIVTIIKKDAEKVKIGEMEDYWYQIEYKGTNGWIFGYFVDLYNSYDEAKLNASKYLEDKPIENNISNYLDEYSINKNLFFISSGNLYQVIDIKSRFFKKLYTLPDYFVSDYFFNKNSMTIFYIAKKMANENGNLYLYYLNNQTNQLIEYNVYSADISENNNLIIILNKQKNNKNNYWQFSSRTLDSKSKTKNITKIFYDKDVEILNVDIFTKTLAREKSSLVYLKYDEKGNFIYFKMPNDKLTYIISLNNGDYIKTEKEQETNFYIDSSQYISISSSLDSKQNIIYNLILNDKFSGKHREIIKFKILSHQFFPFPKKKLFVYDYGRFIKNYR